MKVKQRSKINQVDQVPRTTFDFLTECDTFLDACKGLSANPLQLLHVLFSPQPFNKDTTEFDIGFHAALLGDAAGLCIILRDHTAGVDRVYMNPKAVEQLTDFVPSSFFLNHVKLLAQALQKFPAPPHDWKCGKLFKEVVTKHNNL